MRSMMAAGILLLTATRFARADDVRGELSVVKEGEKVAIDLATLKEWLHEDLIPRDPTKFVITCRDSKATVSGWVVDLLDVKPGEDITIVHEKIGLKVVLKVTAAEGRRCEVRVFKACDAEALAVSMCDAGAGDWKIEADTGFTVATKDRLAVNEIVVAQLNPLASASKSAVSVVRSSVKLTALTVAERYYQAILEGAKIQDAKDQRKFYLEKFAPLWNKTNRARAEMNDIISMHWTAGLNIVKRSKVREYAYVREEVAKRTDGRRIYYFKRTTRAGDDLGEARVVVALEDGAWVIDSSTNE